MPRAQRCGGAVGYENPAPFVGPAPTRVAPCDSPTGSHRATYVSSVNVGSEGGDALEEQSRSRFGQPLRRRGIEPSIFAAMADARNRANDSRRNQLSARCNRRAASKYATRKAGSSAPVEHFK